MNSTDAPRKPRRSRAAALIAALCITTGFITYFQRSQNGFADPKPPSHSTALPSVHRSALAAPDLAASEISHSSPTPPATLRSPRATIARGPDPAEPNGLTLPPPPSGDYELALSPEQITSLVETGYGGLFPSLGLPPPRLARLRALLIERQQVTIDAANAALLFGLNPVRDLPEILHAIELFQTGVDATIRDEFGDSVFASYREFDATRPERNSVEDFRRLVAADPEPLRPEQAQRLIRLMGKLPGRSSPLDFESAIYGRLKERSPITDPILAAAGDVLSPFQLERLRQLQRRFPAQDAER